MSSQVELSVVIINYKTPELILACIASIYKHTTDTSFEIIIINNASKANDKELILGQFPDSIWIETGYNAGFGRANNLGMKAAKGEYILLLNSDTLLINHAISQCLTRLKNDKTIAAASIFQLNNDFSPKPVQHSFAHLLRYSWILLPFQSSDRFLQKLIPENKHSKIDEIDYLPGAFVMLSKELFDKTGGFDENLFMYAEDCEWSTRLSNYGSIILFQDLTFIHDEWGSSPERKENQKNISFFNRFDTQAQLSNLYFIRKHYGVHVFTALMLHYWLWVPLFFLIKFVSSCKDFKNPFIGYEAQHTFANTIRVFSKYFWKIAFQKTFFLKIGT